MLGLLTGGCFYIEGVGSRQPSKNKCSPAKRNTKIKRNTEYLQKLKVGIGCAEHSNCVCRDSNPVAWGVGGRWGFAFGFFLTYVRSDRTTN